MIKPEPITVEGRDGVVVFLDRDGIPVDPESDEAVLARAIFDDGGRATYAVEPKTGTRTDLGGEGSGNFGHSGRPGHVGGSSKVTDTLEVKGKSKKAIAEMVESYGLTLNKIKKDPSTDTWVIEVTGGRDELDKFDQDTELRRDGLDSLDLGGAGSGNFGHAGRPGEVGGSGGTAGTTGVKVRSVLTAADKKYLNENSTRMPDEVVAIGDKKDGEKLIFVKPHGVAKAPTPAQVKTVFGGQSPHDVAGQMLEDLPGEVQAHVTQGKNSKYPDSVVVDVYAIADNGPGNSVKVARQFIRTPDGKLIVYHDAFEVPKKAQGKGLAKAVLADSMQAYRAMGVDRVETTANLDAGGYAWAKFGFKAKDPAKLAETLTARVKGAGRGQLSPVLGDATPKQRAGLTKVIEAHRTDATLPWHIANTVGAKGRALGKELLFETNWDGVLDLTDTESMRKFDAYVKGH